MTPPSPRRLALFGFAELRPTNRGTYRLHFRWARIFCFLAALAVIGYLTAATGVYLLYKERKGFSEVTFVDVLLWQRESLREKQGHADIARGIEALQRGSGREAFNYLRTGVDRSPEHLEGRLLLIRLYTDGFPQLAEQLFEGGLTYHSRDPLFMESYARFLIQRRKDAEAIALAQNVLADPEAELPLKQAMARLAMHSSNRLGHFSEAERLYAEYALGTSGEGVLEAVETLARLNRRPEAIQLLQRALQVPAFQPLLSLHTRLIGLYLNEGNNPAATEVALNLSLRAPLEWQPRLLLLGTYEKGGRDAEIKREAFALLRQFRKDPAALTALARFAQQAGRIDIARQAYEVALENDLDVARFGLLFIETHLSAGKFSEALALCREIEAEGPSWLTQYMPEFNSMRSIASYATGNIQQGALYQREFLRDAKRRPGILRIVAHSYRRAGTLNSAYEILEEAYVLDPADETTLADLVELQIDLGESRDLTDRVNALLALRRPGYDVFIRAQNELASDRFLFAAHREELARDLQRAIDEIARPVPLFEVAPQI